MMNKDQKRKISVKDSPPFLQSLRPQGDSEALILSIQQDMERGGFLFMENIDLNPEARTSLGHRSKASSPLSEIREYVFLIRYEKDISGDIDLMKAAEAMNKVSGKRILGSQTSMIALCIFAESISEGQANEIVGSSNVGNLVMYAAYERSTGKVYFINDKKSRFSMFPRLQGIIRRYIAGDKTEM